MARTAAPEARRDLTRGEKRIRRKGRRLNLCLVSEEYPPETGWGGIGTYTYHLARGLVEQGHRVHVVTRGWGEDTLTETGGLKVYRISIPEPSWRRGTYFATLRFPQTREILLWTHRVSRVVRRIHAAERLDLIESPEYRAQGLLASLAPRRVPMVVKLHTPAWLCREINGMTVGGSRADTLVSEALEYRLARSASLVTSPSRGLAEDVCRRWQLDAGTVRVIPNPVDEEMFRPDASQKPRGQTLVYVGRLERRKGVETLIDALPAVLQRFPGVRVTLVGNDHPSGPGGTSMEAHLRERLARLRVPEGVVEFTGAVDRSELPAIYASASICVVPSLYENFPYTCLEAMASGCAVVASRVGGIPEMVTAESDGLLVPPGSAPDLAAAINRLLAEPALCRKLGVSARSTVCRRFGQEAVCAETARVYEELLDAA